MMMMMMTMMYRHPTPNSRRSRPNDFFAYSEFTWKFCRRNWLHSAFGRKVPELHQWSAPEIRWVLPRYTPACYSTPMFSGFAAELFV